MKIEVRLVGGDAVYEQYDYNIRLFMEYPFYGVPGTRTAKYCATHDPNGMVNISCRKRASCGMPGTRTAEYCILQAPNGRVPGVRKRSVQNTLLTAYLL